MGKTTITIPLTGRIDSGNAAEWENRILPQVDKDAEIVLDAADLIYISSAGLRILMKARKQSSAVPRIINVSTEVYEILEMTGFTELMDVEKRFREISVEGCRVIGKGFCGTVYRLDAETIVKVYYPTEDLDVIRNEQRLARQAFVKGVPTAISYDIVKVGDCFGAVYELLDAQTFNAHLIGAPEQFDRILQLYTDTLKTVHAAVMDPDVLPMAKNTFLSYLDVISDYLTQEQRDGLTALLQALPDDLHMVHCDFQMKNVMLVGDEPMLIDMDTIATGQPIFDLQALYVTYVLFGEDDPDNLQSFLGIPQEWGDRIWNRVLENYFGTAEKAVLQPIRDKIRLLGTVRFLYLIATSDLKNGELGAKRIDRAQRYIAELLPTVATLL